MQDASVISANPERLLTAQTLRSLGELNLRFLDLAGAAPHRRAGEWMLRVPPDLSQRIAALAQDRRAALSNCPYALFDIRFCDDAHWHSTLQTGARWRVNDVSPEDAGMAEFTQLALFYSWHLAASSPLSAPLILGMNESTVRALACVTLDKLPGLIEAQRHHVSLRWPNCKPFWHLLTSAASVPGSRNLRRAQLFGLQVAAATRLSSTRFSRP
jgi:hypothetical protein